jgi:hypothetical protein
MDAKDKVYLNRIATLEREAAATQQKVNRAVRELDRLIHSFSNPRLTIENYRADACRIQEGLRS